MNFSDRGNILKIPIPNHRQYRFAAIFIVILAVGIAFRSVHQSDWLVFKSDQARDAFVVTRAMTEGFFSLPLLGPEAGSTKFRLGPITYYFQYVSGKLFGGIPEAYAYPDLVFGILTLPILFLLFRRFLTLPVSLWLTALASVSLFLVTFSRFSWNPNSLPFFTALFAWCFLNTLEHKRTRRLLYLIGASVCVGIIAQLHVVAIIGLMLGLGAFLITSRTLNLREIILWLAIVALLQLPVFVHEWQTDGANIRAFIRAASGETYQDAKHTWYEKTFRTYQKGASITWIILTGQQSTDTILTRGFSLKCDQECQAALPISLLAMILFGFILTATYRRWQFTTENTKRQPIAFLGWWLAGFLFVTFLVAYETEARFFLGIIPPLLVSIGFAAESLLETAKRPWLTYGLIVVGLISIALNTQATIRYLRELALSQISSQESGRDLRFGTEPKVTLGQLRAIAQTTKQRFKTDTPLLITGESHHVKSMYYILSSEYGYRGCYQRGTVRNLPEGFNHLFIEEYHPTRNDLMPFGTLGAAFQPAASPNPEAALPEKCLTY